MEPATEVFFHAGDLVLFLRSFSVTRRLHEIKKISGKIIRIRGPESTEWLTHAEFAERQPIIVGAHGEAVVGAQAGAYVTVHGGNHGIHSNMATGLCLDGRSVRNRHRPGGGDKADVT